MKTKSILLIIGLLVCATIIVNAQVQDESRIKILRTEKPGVIKIIHAINTDQPVLVRFTNDDGIVGEDNIGGTFPKGLSRRYDLTKIYNKKFRVQISSELMEVTYQIVPSKDKKTFTAFLEKVEHHQVLAAR